MGEANAQIPCNVEYGGRAQIYIGMCYARHGDDLNITENCVFCGAMQDGEHCTLFYGDGAVPDWKVSVRNETAQDCIFRRTTILEIPRVSMADNDGIVYCVWRDSGKLQPNIYEQHNLRVTEPAPTWIQGNWKYMAIGGGLLTGVVVLVVVLLMIAFVHLWKKVRRAQRKRKGLKRNRRPSPPNSRHEHEGKYLLQ